MRKTLKIIFSLFVVLVFITTALPCYAAKNKTGGQAPQEIGDIIYGCYKKVNGQLRIVSGPENCNPSELPISWSNAEGAGGGDLSTTYVVTCQNTSNCSCDTSSTAGMVLSGYAECPAGAVLASVGTPVDEADQGFQASCMNLDGTYVAPAYISIRCIPLSVEANCSDLVDNDGDGAVDCADADCASDAVCQPPVPVEICNDLIDNDDDGAVDCADADCASDAACQSPTLSVPVENCSDGIDNDGDGKTDCKDKDCKQTAACK